MRVRGGSGYEKTPAERHGERHQVTVVEGGFAYRRRRYRSLSAIARAITGTQWNGWVLFRLKQPNATAAR
jgi:hypothetical protein